MDTIDKSPPARPKRRWGRRLAAIVTLTLLALIAAFPTLMSTEPARRWLLDRANKALNPGRLEVARFRFSWFRPTRLDGFALRDPQGDRVIDCADATWDRNFFQILFRKPRYGTLRLDRGIVDIERSADGSIDLVEALRPILNGTPQTDWTIRVTDGQLRIRSPELIEPIQAAPFDVTIRRSAAPGHIAWQASLAEPGRSGARLAIGGDFDRWDEDGDGFHRLALNFDARDWPLAVASGDINARGRANGAASLSRNERGFLQATDLRIEGLRLDGPALRGDVAKLGSALFKGKFGQDEHGPLYAFDLDIQTSVAQIAGDILVPSSRRPPGHLTGKVDLASLASMLPHTLHLREGLTVERGTLSLDVRGKQVASTTRTWTATARVADLAGRVQDTPTALRQDAIVGVTVRNAGGELSLEGANIASAFLTAEGKGDLDHGISLQGQIDLKALQDQAADFIDLGRLSLAGVGRIEADCKREGRDLIAHLKTSFDEASIGPDGDALMLDGLQLALSTRGEEDSNPLHWPMDAEVSIQGASRAGLALGPTKIAGHRTRDAIMFDPIDTTLNGGRLHLAPELVTEPSPILKLGKGAALVDAEVNEEASRRVLAFVNPILEGASRVRGRVSAKFDRADFPLAKNVAKTAVVEGNVVFQDVVFSPGPMAEGVLALIGRSDATMRLDQPVVLSISDGVVHQRGLAVPVGNVTKIEIEGSVGFDRSLDLRTTIPITSAMFPPGGPVGEVAAGTRITVPIGGTLDKPKIDKEAFRAGLADAGKGLLIRGAADLLFRLARPRDPNAPPPPTPAERRERRIERRMQRRGAG